MPAQALSIPKHSSLFSITLISIILSLVSYLLCCAYQGVSTSPIEELPHVTSCQICLECSLQHSPLPPGASVAPLTSTAVPLPVSTLYTAAPSNTPDASAGRRVAIRLRHASDSTTVNTSVPLVRIRGYSRVGGGARATSSLGPHSARPAGVRASIPFCRKCTGCTARLTHLKGDKTDANGTLQPALGASGEMVFFADYITASSPGVSKAVVKVWCVPFGTSLEPPRVSLEEGGTGGNTTTGGSRSSSGGSGGGGSGSGGSGSGGAVGGSVVCDHANKAFSAASTASSSGDGIKDSIKTGGPSGIDSTLVSADGTNSSSSSSNSSSVGGSNGTTAAGCLYVEEGQRMVELLLAQQRVIQDCGLDDVTVKVWKGPVNAISPHPGSGEHIWWEGLWMDVAEGVSGEKLTKFSYSPAASKAHLMNSKLNKTQVVRAALYDALTMQTDRHPQNVFISPETGNIKLIDNLQAWQFDKQADSGDSLFLPGTQEFEIVRLGINYVNKNKGARVPLSLNPLTLLDYRCYVPAGRLNTSYPPQVSHCLRRLTSLKPLGIMRHYQLPRHMATLLYKRARDLQLKGLEWTLQHSGPTPVPAKRYLWSPPCCSLQAHHNNTLSCAHPWARTLDLPHGEVTQGQVWLRPYPDPGTFIGGTEHDPLRVKRVPPPDILAPVSADTVVINVG